MNEETVHIDYEMEFGNKNRKFFVKVTFEPFKMYVDLKGLPPTALLCAICDGVPFLISKCGPSGKTVRNFVDSDWIINDWGGDKELVAAVKKRKEMILAELPIIKEKIANGEIK